VNVRLLNANEIECRVQSVKKTKTGVGCILLLYKDARVDMKLLDETFGAKNWQRTHEVINGNLFCNIEIWDSEKKCWIKKQDVGTESNTEKEKGQASDSFKRAGFNWGIGRELYTSPFIWVDLKEGEYCDKDGKTYINPRTKFTVKSIGYNEEREIISLQIVDNHNVVRYELGKVQKKAEPPKGETNNLMAAVRETHTKHHGDSGDLINEVITIDNTKAQVVYDLLDKTRADVPAFLKYYKVSKVEDMTVEVWTKAVRALKGKLDK
jgi:hypothetical protein